MNLHNLFDIPRKRTPDKIAIDFPEGRSYRQLTYAELYAIVERMAAGLQKWGLQKGDRVAFYMSSRPELLILYLAVIRVGAIMVPINLRYRRREIGHILADCTPRLLVTERAQQAILDEVGLADYAIETTLWDDEMTHWEADAAKLQSPVITSDDLALIMYTSGTTGQSKGAMISHNNVIATVTGLVSAWAWEPADRLLLCLPLFHTHGLVVGAHCALATGATILLRSAFNGPAIVHDLQQVRPTLFFAVPTIYVRLLDELRKDELHKTETLDLSHMRLFCSGSAPLAPETHNAFEVLTGQVILERYGMTETGMNLSNPYIGARIPGSVGTPLPGVSMRVVNEQGEDLPPNEEGELLVRGSNVFSGYWCAPEKTAASFSHDALGQQWFHTGDLARQDPATGYVTLLGRRHELIISGGFNIYPREIEELLETYPGITEAAVIGIPHAEWGEVPAAYLVCDTGADSDEVDDDELIAYCKGQLASFKVPREIYRVKELPRNAMGKLQKHFLKQ